MKRPYVTPVAVEEAFAPNSYVAACSVTQSSVLNGKMQCLNPTHEHFMDGNLWKNVWVDPVIDCDIKITGSSKATYENVTRQPPKDAYVYTLDGPVQLTNQITYNGVLYYVPTSVSEIQNSGPCYGGVRQTNINAAGNYEKNVLNS